MLAGPALAQGGPLLFQAEAQVLSGQCAGQSVRVEGNHNTIQMRGSCAGLLVKGVGNHVQVPLAAGSTIRVEGSENEIRFVSATPPLVQVFGPGNDVASGAAPHAALPVAAPPPAQPASLPPSPPMAQPGPGPLVLTGDDAERLEDCAGRDVVVTGRRSAYVVRGACRSVSVRGDLLTVQVVVQPGARIVVTGLGSSVSWAMTGRGRAPVSIVRGAGSKVQKALSIGGELVK